MEQERSARQQSDNEKPALLAAPVESDKQPNLSPVDSLSQEDEEDRDSSSLNADSVQYLSANEILAKIKSNPISRNGTAANHLTKTKQVSTSIPMCGVELIKKFEGCYLNAYPDPLSGGIPITIGWGTTRKRDGSPWYMGESISQQQADELLIYQLETSYLPDLVKIPCWGELNPNQQGALLSFGYNLGSKFYGAANFESMTRVLKNKDWANIRETFIKYRNPGSNVEQGLRRRREAEAELFLKPYP
ncbi:lysozyme [Anabaena lutea FACHB-196]|uniref:Lysozyme n=1 Tax=Anabaena lutea FACHB-196 TaxID=2692881 RepID=A0ABR8FCP1_9NOST|nr:lysozyme [Anabaena lutea FACHB-196]